MAQVRRISNIPGINKKYYFFRFNTRILSGDDSVQKSTPFLKLYSDFCLVAPSLFSKVMAYKVKGGAEVGSRLKAQVADRNRA